MPFLKCLDITGCQNIAADSMVTYLLMKETLEVLKSYECQIAFKLMENPRLVYSSPSLKLKLQMPVTVDKYQWNKLEIFCTVENDWNFFLFLLAGVHSIFGQTFSVILSMSNLGIP